MVHEVFKPKPGQDPGAVFYTITPEDVGAPFITTTAGEIRVSYVMGRILAGDVGKRIYRVRVDEWVNQTGEFHPGWIWQAENDRQRDKRLARTRRTR